METDYCLITLFLRLRLKSFVEGNKGEFEGNEETTRDYIYQRIYLQLSLCVSFWFQVRISGFVFV